MTILDDMRSHIEALFRARERVIDGQMREVSMEGVRRGTRGGSGEVTALSNVIQEHFKEFQCEILKCVDRNLRSAPISELRSLSLQVQNLVRSSIADYKTRFAGILQSRVQSDIQRACIQPLIDDADLHLHELRIGMGVIQRAVDWQNVAAESLLALGLTRADDSRFNSAELAGIDNLLQKLMGLVQEQHNYIQGHLDAQDERLLEMNNRIRHLIANSATMNRKDWFALALGTLGNLIT